MEMKLEVLPWCKIVGVYRRCKRRILPYEFKRKLTVERAKFLRHPLTKHITVLILDRMFTLALSIQDKRLEYLMLG